MAPLSNARQLLAHPTALQRHSSRTSVFQLCLFLLRLFRLYPPVACCVQQFSSCSSSSSFSSFSIVRALHCFALHCSSIFYLDFCIYFIFVDLFRPSSSRPPAMRSPCAKANLISGLCSLLPLFFSFFLCIQPTYIASLSFFYWNYSMRAAHFDSIIQNDTTTTTKLRKEERDDDWRSPLLPVWLFYAISFGSAHKITFLFSPLALRLGPSLLVYFICGHHTAQIDAIYFLFCA